MVSCNSKIIVFDLDETLGYFMELGMLWDGLKAYIKYKKINYQIDQELFNKVLDLYPEFLRPGILNILNYLKRKKEKNYCHKLLIYTNNQGPKEWANYIMKYFEKKINYKIFDQLIAAFKVQGKRVELCRTTHMKTHEDLIKCAKLPKETQICFLDDVFYPEMSNEKLYYINVKPYIYDLNLDEMINRFIKSGILVEEPSLCKDFLKSYMEKYTYIYVGKTREAQNLDKIVSKKILQHLQTFLNSPYSIKLNGNQTKKTNRIKIIKNKTLKK
jgi:hypothetical protein